MKASTLLPVVVTSLTLVLPLASLSATPLWDVDFNGDPSGAPPSTAPAVAGQVATKPTSTATGGTSTITVVASAGGLSKPVQINNVASAANSFASTNITFQGNAADFSTPTPFSISLDVVFTAGPDFTTTSGQLLGIEVKNNIGSTLGRVGFALNTSVSGNSYLFTSGDYFSSEALINSNAHFEYNTLHTLVLNFIDLGGANPYRMQVLLDGNLAGTKTLSNTVAPNFGLDSFRLINASGGTALSNNWTAAVDNIAVVPEPTSIALLIVAGGLLIVARRRRSVNGNPLPRSPISDLSVRSLIRAT